MLKRSPNENIRHLWADTSTQNINSDSLLITNSTSEAHKKLNKTQKEEAVLHMTGLSSQDKSIKVGTENLAMSTISNWSKMTNSLPVFLFNFTHKAIQPQLPTLESLVRDAGPPVICVLCVVQ